YESPTHVVRAGETLYTIAWQHGVDYRALAAVNRLSNPDLIFPGQRLRLRSPSAAVAATDARSTADRKIRAPARSPQAAVLPQPSWSWPTHGELAARFGSDDGIGTGIAVTGRSGQSILAAADGRVVYVGTGLVGYGQLVIVKHNDAWLSAYGHTEAVLVGQGDTVSQGERIAAMGLGPRRQPRLHFEIRRNGVPVDPLSLLPARR
ncbi:MAG: peptidoglycan DD-metalloendopeptidase family protein, partial [Gammaproteobacteria bacterium]